jgi:hypothetical protein
VAERPVGFGFAFAPADFESLPFLVAELPELVVEAPLVEFPWLACPFEPLVDFCPAGS